MTSSNPERINKLFSYMEGMSPEQLDERIKQIRAERRNYKKRPAKIKKESLKASATAKDLLAGMSEAEIAALLKDLEE